MSGACVGAENGTGEGGPGPSEGVYDGNGVGAAEGVGDSARQRHTTASVSAAARATRGRQPCIVQVRFVMSSVGRVMSHEITF